MYGGRTSAPYVRKVKIFVAELAAACLAEKAKSWRSPYLSGEEKINFSTVFAGQAVGIKEIHDDIWLVSFMDYDLGYFDLEARVLEPLENPFDSRVLPIS